MLRLGCVSYSNTLPLMFPIEQGIIPLEAEKISAVPAELNQMLREGEIDVGLVSAYEYLSNRELYDLAAPIGIAAYEKVLSVCLYVKGRICDLEGQTIGLTRESASSANLLRLLARRYWNVNCEYEIIRSPEEGLDFPAFLLIGDASLTRQSLEGYRRVDLAQAWAYATGLPFTFAVLACRKGTQGLEPLVQSLEASLKWSAQNKEKVLGRAIELNGMPMDLLQEYYTALIYQLGPRELEGLELYGHLLAEEESPHVIRL